MSKKSGFFYSLLAMMGMMSMTPPIKGSNSTYQPSGPSGGGGGTGKTTRSYGTKPDYGHLKRKPFYQIKTDARKQKHYELVAELAELGIIWTNTKLYRDKAI